MIFHICAASLRKASKVTNSAAVIELCYCIPEFHHLTMDTLPDASSLIRQLKESIDCEQPKARHDTEESSPPLKRLMV